MEQLEHESKSKIERKAEMEAAMERARRKKIFQSHGLDSEDIARTTEMSASDPVGAYIGYPEVQAQMIADEKARRDGIVAKVVQGIAGLIRR